ncbi:Transposase [Leuconostoc gasicomitatum]
MIRSNNFINRNHDRVRGQTLNWSDDYEI